MVKPTLSLLTFSLLLPWILVGQQPADLKASRSEAKRWASGAFSGKAKKETSARSRLARVRPEDRPRIFEALEKLKLRTEGRRPKKDRIVAKIETPDAEQPSAPYVLRFPRGYDHKKRMPLLLRFHGSGGHCDDFDQYLGVMKPWAPYIQLTPEIPSSDRMGWNQAGTFAMLDRLIRKVSRDYAVDLDRVYFYGFSAGGGAAFYLSQIWPHRVAAFYAMGRLHWAFPSMPEESSAVARHIPGYFAIGLKDIAERVKGYRDAQKIYEGDGYRGVFRFEKNKGHEYLLSLDGEASKFMRKHRRVRYPKSFDILYYAWSNEDWSKSVRHRQYWFETAQGDFNVNGTPGTIAVEKNLVRIRAPELKAGSLLLNDALVDLDQPVKVELDGEVVFDAMVERSVPFLLAWMDEHRDPGDLYWNRISFRR